jgi:hypothetical protein
MKCFPTASTLHKVSFQWLPVNKKKVKNISGLRNQSRNHASVSDQDVQEEEEKPEDNKEHQFDGLKVDLGKEFFQTDNEYCFMAEDAASETATASDDECASEWEEDDFDLQVQMAKMILKEEQEDGEWLPPTVRYELKRKSGPCPA